MQIRSFRGSGEPVWVNALLLSARDCLGPDPRRALGPAATPAASTGRTRDRKRINHEEAYSMDDACTNWAEEFFSSMCHAEIGIHHHIAGAYLLRYAQDSSWREDNRTVSKSTASRLCLRSVASQLILVAIGSGTRKMFMPEQKLHTHEEVFKDHVTGQYDETIFRFRVPCGWIYTHTIVRFGSVDKNYVADTFVPDSK